MSFFGNLTYDSKSDAWQITDLSPHVAIHFKRLFPRVPKQATEIELSDSDEIRADLDWFMQRYPLRHNFKTALAEASDRLRAKAAYRAQILRPDFDGGPVEGFKIPPYAYQMQAVRLAISNGGLLLGDEVGLGKTVSAIAAILCGAPSPAAVFVQPHLGDQWVRKIREFSHLKVHLVKGGQVYQLPPADVYIFRYTIMSGWSDIFKEGWFKSVIYDEIQELRTGTNSAKGQAAVIASGIADFKMGLSATPIFNQGDEMHTVMGYLNPDLLGDRDEFSREWCGGGSTVKDPDALGSYLAETGWLLIRDEHSETVNKGMPPPNVLSPEVEHSLDDVEQEEALMQRLAMKVLHGGFKEAGNAARELDLKMRMLTGVGKARSVAAYVKLLLQDNERVFLSGWHRAVYDIWRKELDRYSPVFYTGTETPAYKKHSIEQFCNGKSRVFIISNRSGAGLDGLQHHCNQYVAGEFDWSPQIHHQLAGRLRRAGQTEQVDVHYPWVNWGSDPLIMEINAIKSDQSRGILRPGQEMALKVSDENRLKRLARMVLGEVE